MVVSRPDLCNALRAFKARLEQGGGFTAGVRRLGPKLGDCILPVTWARSLVTDTSVVRHVGPKLGD